MSHFPVLVLITPPQPVNGSVADLEALVHTTARALRRAARL